MGTNVSYVPEEYHAVTPSLYVRDVDKALDFYKKAFGAEQVSSMNGPGGKLAYGELKIRDSIFIVCGEGCGSGCVAPASLKASSVGLVLYVPDADAVFKAAIQAGGVQREAVKDMFWGDRCGTLADPFGHVWTVATHKEELSELEISKRAEQYFLQTAKA
ncbi:MAG: VOC family protein [Elusimicrobia bacterium]|nr:VOC family protein [Elusimicrobiota bacterium]